MIPYYRLPIYLTIGNVLLEYNKVVPSISRDARYTIARDVSHDLLRMMMLVYRASVTRDKVPVISEMRELLIRVKLQLRLLCVIFHFPDKRYAMLADELTSVSKQLAKWEKAERLRNGDDNGVDDTIDEETEIDNAYENIKDA